MESYTELLRVLVRQSVAAEETKAHALGVKLDWAASSKSCALIRVSRGGLDAAFRGGAWVRGGGLGRSCGMVVWSNVPMRLDAGSEVLISDGEWTSE